MRNLSVVRLPKNLPPPLLTICQYWHIITGMKQTTRHTPKRLSIADLQAQTGLRRRTIRFYIERGLLPHARGAGRGGFYTGQHVEVLRRAQALLDSGLTIELARRVLEGKLSPDEARKRVPPQAASLSQQTARFGSPPPVSADIVAAPTAGGQVPSAAQQVDVWTLAPGIALTVRRDRSLTAKDRDRVYRAVRSCLASYISNIPSGEKGEVN